MKKFALLMTVLSLTMFSANAHAQPAGGAASSGASTGQSFAWGIGLGALAVLGTMTGLVVSSSTSSPTTFSHS